MLKYILSFFMIVALSSCNAPTNSGTGADGYIFGHPEYELSTVEVSIVTYKNKNDFMNAAEENGVASEDLVAFTVLHLSTNRCTMHIMHPSVKYEPEFVGHEFLHCVYGQWHTNNDSRS